MNVRVGIIGIGGTISSTTRILAGEESSEVVALADPDPARRNSVLEGINDVETAYLDALTPAMLEGRSLVLLGAADPEPEAVQWLIDFAYHGGGLICCAPGEALAAALGLAPLNQGVMHGRLPVALAGFPEAGLPLKGWIQHYSGAENEDHTDTIPLHDFDQG